MTELIPEPAAQSGELDTIRVETALSRFPMHSLTGGEVQININNLGTATRWEISPNPKYGQPGWLAYKLDTLVINRRIEEEGKPIPKIIRLGTIRDIASELGINKDTGSSSLNIKKALKQNAFAGIDAKISFKTKEGTTREIEFADTRYAVVFTGEKFPDGRKADAVYIMLHDIYRDILNSAQTRPLDYAYMKALPPMAQRFYEIISYVIYAALLHRNKTCKMRYSEFCKLSTATRYHTFDQVKKQMYKIHKPHIENGYLRPAPQYQGTTDEEGKPDWWIFYEPGINAGRQYEEFTQAPKRRAAPTTEIPAAQRVFNFIEDVPAIPEKATTAPQDEPQGAQNPSPETLALTSELVRVGVSKGVALTLASTQPEECRRQLQYLPYAEIKSTPGAYLVTAIKGEYGTPKAFQEIEAKRQEQERKRKAQEAQAARDRAAAIRKEAEAALTDSEIATLESDEPEQYAEFQKFVEEQKAQALNKPFIKRGSTIEGKLLQDFQKPEKRRELFAQWRTGASTPAEAPSLPQEPGKAPSRPFP